MALSVGLDTAVKALRAHQLAVDVASHNIANALTPGFSRQRVLLRPVGLDGNAYMGRDSLLGRAGMGVDASDVQRVRNPMLDFQARQFLGAQAQFTALANALQQAEFVFNEPTDEGLSVSLAAYWNAWHDVVNDPESASARTALVHAATTLAVRLNRTHANLTIQRDDLNIGVRALADEINGISREIADLNLRIKQVELNGEMANDLRDRRDVLLDDLSKIASISYSEQEDSTVVVYLGNHELVVATQWRKVVVQPQAGNPGMDELVFELDGLPVQANTGKLAGLLEARDVTLLDLLAKVDDLANGLRTEVNALHQAGFGLDGTTGEDFFVGTGARDIAVNPLLMAAPEKIAAASAAGLPGDGSLALQIANLQHTKTMAGGTLTIDEFYASLVSVLGADTARAQGLAETNDLLMSHLESMRQSVSGVNIDEEVTNLTQAQHAYSAAARVLTAIDEMLDLLINRTGMVGR
ncbi:MAG: flagellar hook-associated protein FlgK [Dehalococcoidia bacterium]